MKGIKFSLEHFLSEHLVWVITMIFTLGAFWATVKYQGDSIANNVKEIEQVRERVTNIEKAIVRLENIKEDLKDIKYELRDVKKSINKL